MNNVMGLINLHENTVKLDALTQTRPLAAVPFGSKYRMIDFALSNMVNSGVHNVGILIPEHSGALIQHLRAGKDWDLDRKHEGLFLLIPTPRTPLAGTGDVDYYSQHLDYLLDAKQEYVILSASQFLCNLNYGLALEYHQKSKADATLIYRRLGSNETRPSDAVMLSLDDDRFITDMEIAPPQSKSRNLYMSMAITGRKLLIDVITNAMSRGGGDYVRQLQANLKNLRLNAWEFTGYTANISDVREYYRHHMALLNQAVWRDLFFRNGHIYTKVKDSVPTKYLSEAKVENSILANSCQINGSVKNSVLFRSVHVAKGAVVKNSIIMQYSYIGSGARLENAICDKDVEITPGRSLKGDPLYPLVIKKGTVV
ncbi:MAG: glucose-1-phosphate adenylyltransferase subunit GlgD [Acidaminococcales bacterium]|jgi:glucose-1-phosphate adenylyltransferase|nr:glucose-1-phosphate adenylyltransferase subunit GlgD [Acidaminococcales bacterium]